jgi:hypothetical protein
MRISAVVSPAVEARGDVGATGEVGATGHVDATVDATNRS